MSEPLIILLFIAIPFCVVALCAIFTSNDDDDDYDGYAD